MQDGHRAVDPRHDRWIGDRHFARDIANQHGADRDDDRESFHDLEQQRRTKNDQRDADCQADDE